MKMTSHTLTKPNVAASIVFAMKAHEGQLRKYDKAPYVQHCVEVGCLVDYFGGGSDVVCAAILHDTLEDTKTTYKDLVEHFGENVANLVSEVTDVSTLSDGNRKVRKEIDRKHLAQASVWGQFIKCADIISNTRSIAMHDPAFSKVYLPEIGAVLDVLTKVPTGPHSIRTHALQVHNEACLELGIR